MDHQYRRQTAVMLLGILIMAIGVVLFKLSLMGNDPSGLWIFL